MLIVIDINVVISALLSPKGSPARIIELWEEEAFDLATSPQLLDELARALEYDQVKKYFKQPQEKISTLLKRINSVGIVVDPQIELAVIEVDPDDNHVLACAEMAQATYIVSGDEHLLSLKKHQEIFILSPAEFLTLMNIAGKKK